MRYILTLFILILFIGGATGLIFDNDGNGSWSYYVSFPITQPPSQTEIYKIIIKENTWKILSARNTLCAEGQVYEFWSNVKSDGTDIRVFTDKEQLYFWLEEFDYSNKYAIIWTKIKPNTEKLNIAFGNPKATESSYHNPNKIFTLFEDFNQHNYTVIRGSASQVGIIDGWLRIDSRSGYSNKNDIVIEIDKEVIISGDFAVEMKVYLEQPTEWVGVFTETGGSGYTCGWYGWKGYGSIEKWTDWNQYILKGEIPHYIGEQGSTQILRWDKIGSKIRLWDTDLSKVIAEVEDNSYNEFSRVAVRVYKNAIWKIDWIRVYNIAHSAKFDKPILKQFEEDKNYLEVDLSGEVPAIVFKVSGNDESVYKITINDKTIKIISYKIESDYWFSKVVPVTKVQATIPNEYNIFNFTKSKKNILLTNESNSPIPFVVEKYDKSKRLIQIWFKVTEGVNEIRLLYSNNIDNTKYENPQSVFIYYNDFENGILEGELYDYVDFILYKEYITSDIKEENGVLVVEGGSVLYKLQTGVNDRYFVNFDIYVDYCDGRAVMYTGVCEHETFALIYIEKYMGNYEIYLAGAGDEEYTGYDLQTQKWYNIMWAKKGRTQIIHVDGGPPACWSMDTYTCTKIGFGALNARFMVDNVKVWEEKDTYNFDQPEFKFLKFLSVIKVIDELNFTPIKGITVISYTNDFRIIDKGVTNEKGIVPLKTAFNGYIVAKNNKTGVLRMVSSSGLKDVIIYFPQTNIIFIQFNIVDSTGLFRGGDIIIKKYVNDSLVEIDRRKITVDFKTNHYLIADEHYQIYIISNDRKEMRYIGYFSSPISRTVNLLIGEIGYSPLLKGNVVDYNITTINNKIILTYNITKGEVNKVEFIVYNSSGKIYYAVANESAGAFTYIINNNNDEYIVEFIANTTAGVYNAKYVIKGGKIKEIHISTPDWLLNMLLGGLCIFTTLTLGRKSVPVALLATTTMLGIFIILKLIEIPLEVFVTLIVLTGLSFFTHKRGG